MKPAVVLCVTCDARTDVHRHEDPKEADRLAAAAAIKAGWQELPEAPPRRFRAVFVCPECIDEISELKAPRMRLVPKDEA